MRCLWLLQKSLSHAGDLHSPRPVCCCGWKQMCWLYKMRPGMSCFGHSNGGTLMKQKKRWYDYLWIVSAPYLILGFVNILFAWLGLLCFFIPLLISIFKGDKTYCNRYCGRGQLFDVLGKSCKLSRQKDIPSFLRSKAFRYGFLVFFFIMFFQMLFKIGRASCRERV